MSQETLYLLSKAICGTIIELVIPICLILIVVLWIKEKIEKDGE